MDLSIIHETVDQVFNELYEKFKKDRDNIFTKLDNNLDQVINTTMMHDVDEWAKIDYKYVDEFIDIQNIDELF